MKEYTLKECLEQESKEELLERYLDIKVEQGEILNNCEKLTKEDLIDLLSLELIEGFKNYLAIIDRKSLDELMNKINKNDALALGFMYVVKNGKTKSYVIPIEFVELAKELDILNGDISRYRFQNFIGFYALINGILKRDFVLKIIDIYNINVDVKVAEEEMKKMGFIFDSDDYFVYDTNEKSKKADDIIKKLKKAKEKFSYKIVDELNMMEYQQDLMMIEYNLANILKSNGIKARPILPIIISFPLSIRDIINNIKQIVKINSSVEENLEEFLEYALEDVRYWALNGRTELELRGEKVLEKYVLDSKPKDASLLTCLKGLKKEIQDEMIEGYFNEEKVSLKELADEIENVYDEEKYYDGLEHFKLLKKCHNKELKNVEEFVYDIEKGCIYIYKENDKIKMFIPNEIKNIIDNADIKEFDY